MSPGVMSPQAHPSFSVSPVRRFKSVWNSVDLTSSVISTGAPDVLEGDDTTDVTITTTDAMLGGSGRTSAAGDSSDAEAIKQIAVVDGKDVESSLGTSPIQDGWMLEPDAAAATSSSGSDAATASSTPASVDPRETDDEESANADKGAEGGEAGGGVIVGEAHEVTNPCSEGNERVGFEESQAVPAGDISGPGEGERTVVETTNEITDQTVGSSRMETSVAGDAPSVVALQDIGGKLADCALRAGEPKNACAASQDAISEADKPASKPELVHAVGGCTPPGGASPFVAAAQPSDSKTPVAATAGVFDGASADAAVEAFAEARADGPGRSSAASEETASQDDDLPPPVHGLVILVPLVLGIGTVRLGGQAEHLEIARRPFSLVPPVFLLFFRFPCAPYTLRSSPLAQLSEAYVPQLKEVLSMPQCIGIVGGRPSSSLYFIGFQEDNIVYLDPHHVQTVRGPAEGRGRTRATSAVALPGTLLLQSFCCADRPFLTTSARAGGVLGRRLEDLLRVVCLQHADLRDRPLHGAWILLWLKRYVLEGASRHDSEVGSGAAGADLPRPVSARTRGPPLRGCLCCNAVLLLSDAPLRFFTLPLRWTPPPSPFSSAQTSMKICASACRRWKASFELHRSCLYRRALLPPRSTSSENRLLGSRTT